MSEENVLTKEIAEQFLADEESVDLSVYTTINEDAAEVLSKYKGAVLNLSGITQIYAATAGSLAKCEGEVWLGGLTELIDDQTIESLSKIKVNPVENAELKKASFKALQELNFYMAYDSHIIFEDPKRIISTKGPFDGNVAEKLLPYKDKLVNAIDFEYLSLEVLTLQKAEDLARTPKKTPWGLEIRDHHHRLITDEAASYLADQDIRSLDLSGLVYLSEESTDFLAGFKGESKGFRTSWAKSSSLPKVLSLNGLVEISPAIARRLAKFDGDLILDRIYNFDLETAKEISSFNALELHLSGMGPNHTDLGELGEFDCLVDFVGADQEKKGVEIDKDVIDAVYKFKGKLHAGF